MGLTNHRRERWCEAHRLSYLGVCPFCEAGVEPTRFVEARQDFAGMPLAGTVDILPHHETVRLEDVVRVCGQQLVEIERRQMEAMRPYTEARRRLIHDMRKANLDPLVFRRAARVVLEVPGHECYLDDLAVMACVACIKAPPSKD